jgi:predicted DNA-binding WGR domain protein
MLVESTHLEQINQTVGENKFYRVTTTGSTAIYQWGRRGSVGQCRVISSTSAWSDARLVVHEKFDRGYTVVARFAYVVPDHLIEVLTTMTHRETRKQALAELTREFMASWHRCLEDDIASIVRSFAKKEDLVVGAIPNFVKEAAGWPWSIPIAECLRSYPTATLPEGKGLLAVLPRSALYGISRVITSYYSHLVGAAENVDRRVLEVAAGLWDELGVGETATLTGALEVAQLVFATNNTSLGNQPEAPDQG